MNAYCINCLGDHPPALCPDEVGEHIKQAIWVTQEINLEALAHKRQTPQAMGWRARLTREDQDPGARAEPVSNTALLEQLSHRFTLRHARAIEERHGGALARARKQRRLRPEVSQRVDELLGQAEAVLGTSARDRMERARRFLEAAVDLDPLDPRIHLRLGFVLARDGRRAQAAEAFHQAAAVLPEGIAPGYGGNARLMASRAAFLAEQYKDAWEHATAAEQAISNDGGVHYQKALVASRYPQAGRSVKLCLRRAVDLDPLYFTLAALDVAFDQGTWAAAVKPLLQEVEDESVQGLIERRDICQELFTELDAIAGSPSFAKLPSTIGGAAEAGHDAHAETRSVLSWSRELLGGVTATFTQGPAARSAVEGMLTQAQQRLKHWILAWQKALHAHLQGLAARAVPPEGKPLPRGAGKAIERLTELVTELETFDPGTGRSTDLLELERRVAREAHALAQLAKPKPKPKSKGPSKLSQTMGQVGFYLSVATAVLAALGADLLVLHSASYVDHPFWATFGAAAFTVYLPELVARLTSPKSPEAGFRLHELAFLPAYLLFPVLPAAAVVHAFPSTGMYMLMMGVCALMSILLIVGFTGRR